MRRSTFASSGSRHVVPTGGGAPFGRKSAAEAGNFARRSFRYPMPWSNAASTTKPRSARSMAGAMSSAQVLFFDPSVCHASHRPATLPGTPTERQPSRDSRVGLPSGPRYMSRVAAAGAVSRKSSAYGLPAMRATRKPPPPRLPASGNATAIAKAVATAASMALPPVASTSTPTFVPIELSVTTIPRAACVDGAPAW